jgi:hypothetical protein
MMAGERAGAQERRAGAGAGLAVRFGDGGGQQRVGARERRAGGAEMTARERADCARGQVWQRDLEMAADSRERGCERGERGRDDDRTVYQKLWTSILTS